MHDAELEIENAWCCTEGLLPVRSKGVAMCLCILNILIPGFGTILSTCFAKTDDQSRGKKIVPDVEPEEEEELDEPEAEDEEGSEKKMLTQGSKGEKEK